MSYILNNEIKYEDTGQLDSFGRLRVANPKSLLNSTLQNGPEDELWQTITAGSGSTTYNPVESSLSLSVTTAQGDRAYRRTFRYFQYQAGISHNILMTGHLGAGVTGITSRIGLFDEDDGIFFEKTDGNLFIVLRKTLSSGNTTEERIAQANFNKDPLDGTGPSEYNIDTSLTQIFRMDLQWLGVGNVRIGVQFGRDFIIAHEFENANKLTTAYMGHVDLPVGYEIENVSGSTSGDSIKEICASIESNGGEITRGFTAGAVLDSDQTYIVPKIGNEWYNFISLRVDPNCKRCHLVLVDISIYNMTDKAFQFAILKNADTSNLIWEQASEFTEKAVLQDETISGGRMVYAGIGSIRGSVKFNLRDVKDRLNNAEGMPGQTFSIVVRRVEDSAELSGAVNFVEFR